MLGVAVHWEAAPPEQDHSRCAGQVESIRQYHLHKGYSDIAYNMLGCQHGGIFNGRGWGRPSGANGTRWSNLNIWAVCYMSGPGHPFTAAGHAAMGTLVQEARARCSPPKSVEPHSFYFNTACPGDEIRAWIQAGYIAGGEEMLSDEDKKLLGKWMQEQSKNVVATVVAEIKKIKPGSGGGVSDAQVRKIVREEINRTKLTG